MPAALDSDVQRALSILRGSDSSYLQAWAAFLLSGGLCVYGTNVCEMSIAEKKFFGQSVMFMMSSGFTLAKTYRDRELANLIEGQAGNQAAVVSLRGTTAWACQVVGAFLLSVGFTFYTLISNVGDGDTTGDSGFAIMASSFALISTLSVAKAVRDRSDAETLEAVDTEDAQTKFSKIMAVSRGSTGNLVVVLAGWLLSFFSTVGGALMMDDAVLSIERKGFVSIAALFMMTSAFHLAKLVRDLADPKLAKDAHVPFRILVVGTFAIACTLSIGGVLKMPIPRPKKRFIVNGLFFMLSTTLSAAKMVRDRNEVAKLEDHPHHD